MRYEDYQNTALGTAVYPTNVEKPYLALGVVNEAGEFAGKVKKILRGDSAVNIDDVASELGDVLWYLAVSASVFSLPFLGKIGGMGKHIKPRVSVNIDEVVDTTVLFIRLINNYFDSLCSANVTFASMYLQKAVLVFEVLCRMLCTEPEVVAQANLDKLASRSSRGTLKGSGDNR